MPVDSTVLDIGPPQGWRGVRAQSTCRERRGGRGV